MRHQILHHLSKKTGKPRADFAELVRFVYTCPDCVAERLGLDPHPRKRNVSRTKGTDYDTLYDPKLRDMVLSRYGEELRLFFNDSGESGSQPA